MPPSTETISEHDANIVNWICASLALTILVLRISTHWHQHRRFNKSAHVVMASVAVLLSRTTCNALILYFDTINRPGFEHVDLWSDRVRIGSILTLVARVLVTTYYWLQSSLLLLFYYNFLDCLHWAHRAIKLAWFTIAVTYIAVILATFLECRPIYLYWTPVSPEPACLRANVQILLQCVSNAAIDVFLLVISLPILRLQIRQFPRNLQLGVLYALGFFCVIIGGFRVRYIYRDGAVQQTRSFWASLQIIVATFVANVPSIYGNLRCAKRRYSSVMSHSRPASGQEDAWIFQRQLFRPPYHLQAIVVPLETHKANARRHEDFDEPP